MGDNQMIVLCVQSKNEPLKELFINYHSLVQKAVSEKVFSERVQIVRELNQLKVKLQVQIADLQKVTNSVRKLENQLFEMIDDKVLQGKLRTGLFFMSDLALLVEGQGDQLPVELKQFIESNVKQLKTEEYLLFWYIEENEWHALLSN